VGVCVILVVVVVLPGFPAVGANESMAAEHQWIEVVVGVACPGGRCGLVTVYLQIII